MKHPDKVSLQQLATILFLSLAVDLVVKPFTQGEGESAQIMIPAAIMIAAVILALATPLFWSVATPQADVLRGGVSEGSKVFLALCTALFSFGMGASIQRAEAFFRYINDEPLPRFIVYFLMFAVALYAMRCGLPAIARLFGLLVWVFVASMALLLIANFGQMRFENLTVEVFSISKICRAAVSSFALSPMILLFFFFTLKPDGKKKAIFNKTIMGLCVFSIILTLCAELVLGQRAQMQIQTVHALSRLGRISVFKRLDAIHITGWMMLEFAKTAAYGIGIQMAGESLIPHSQHKNASWYALGAGVIGLLCTEFISELQIQKVQTIGTAIVLFVMAMVGCRIRWIYEKTKE